MFELLIAASALSLVIMIFRKQSRVLEQKRPIDWAMAGHSDATDAHTEATAETVPEDDTERTEESESATTEPLDFQAINKCFRAAETHYAREEIDDAEKMYIKVLSYHDEHPESLHKLGVIYIQQNDLRKAELMFNKLMGTNTKDPNHFASYGRCLYVLERIEDAITAFEKAIEMDPTKAIRFINLGNIYYKQGSFERALEMFSRALELDPYNNDYLTVVADLSERIGDIERLYKTYKKMLDIDPYNYEVKRKLEKLGH